MSARGACSVGLSAACGDSATFSDGFGEENSLRSMLWISGGADAEGEVSTLGLSVLGPRASTRIRSGEVFGLGRTLSGTAT